MHVYKTAFVFAHIGKFFETAVKSKQIIGGMWQLRENFLGKEQISYQAL